MQVRPRPNAPRSSALGVSVADQLSPTSDRKVDIRTTYRVLCVARRGTRPLHAHVRQRERGVELRLPLHPGRRRVRPTRPRRPARQPRRAHGRCDRRRHGGALWRLRPAGRVHREHSDVPVHLDTRYDRSWRGERRPKHSELLHHDRRGPSCPLFRVQVGERDLVPGRPVALGYRGRPRRGLDQRQRRGLHR